LGNSLTTLSSLISLLLIIVFLLLIKRGTADNLNIRLFTLKNRLFHLAANNKNIISFDSSLYREFEYLINSTEKFSHKINFTKIVVFRFFSLFSKIDIGEISTSLDSRIENCNNNEIKSDLFSIKKDYEKYIAIYLIQTSIICMVFVFFSGIIQFLKTNIFKNDNKKTFSEKLVIIVFSAIQSATRNNVNTVELQAEEALLLSL